MSLLEYYAALRAEILEIVTGVQNSRHSLFWDNTTQNYVTKRKLEDLFTKYLTKARSFGLLMVTRHGNCHNPSHQEYSVSNTYGIKVQYKESGYIWNGGQFYQGPRKCVCPCSSENKETQHHVIEDIIYVEGSNIDVCIKLEEILTDISISIDHASDKKPRSAIREHLLRAILRINDQLLSEPMEVFINKRLTEEAL